MVGTELYREHLRGYISALDWAIREFEMSVVEPYYGMHDDEQATNSLLEDKIDDFKTEKKKLEKELME